MVLRKLYQHSIQRNGGYARRNGLHSVDSILDKDTGKDMRASLAELAKALNVDGVAVIALDMGYRYGNFGKITILGTTLAKPSVGLRMIVVNTNGDIAVNIPNVQRFEGSSCGMVSHDVLVLSHPENKAVKVYDEAIEKAALKATKVMTKEFAKIKV